MRAWGLVAGHRAGAGTDRKASPALPVRSDRREAKTDAGHDGAWLCGCGWSDAGDVRAYGEGRRGRRGWATHLVHIGELRKAEETKSRVLARDRKFEFGLCPGEGGLESEGVETVHGPVRRRAGPDHSIRKNNVPSGSGAFTDAWCGGPRVGSPCKCENFSYCYFSQVFHATFLRFWVIPLY